MSDNPFAAGDNPYQAPVNPSISTGGGGADPGLGQAAEMLRQTKPWVRFISVMCFIGAVFIAFAGVMMMAMGGMAGMAGGGRGAPGVPEGVTVVMGLVYIVMAALYIAPGVFLWMYADRIGVFLHQQTPVALASALQAQKSFWRFVGIVMAIVLALYALGIVFLILVAVLAGLG